MRSVGCRAIVLPPLLRVSLRLQFRYPESLQRRAGFIDRRGKRKIISGDLEATSIAKRGIKQQSAVEGAVSEV